MTMTLTRSEPSAERRQARANEFQRSVDALIAAAALHYNLILLTADKDFQTPNYTPHLLPTVQRHDQAARPGSARHLSLDRLA